MIKRVSYILLFGIISLFPKLIEAQEKLPSIKLLDEISNSPIIGAHYLYGDESGITNKNGEIYINYKSSNKLMLSHISYGNWVLTGEQLDDVLEKGIIFREKKTYNLQPVTIIALHQKTEEKVILGFDMHDKLSHDGGAVLVQNPAIHSIKKSGSYGFDPVLRGFKFDQLNIVIDGAQCATAACPNRMDPPTSQIAPNMMDHVEVFKGPHTLRYGSSFGGTINFVSTSPRFNTPNQFYGRLSGSTESNGGIYRTEGVFGFAQENIDVGLLGSFSSGKDYKDGENIEIPSSFQRASVGLRFGIKLNENNLFNLSATRNIAKDSEFPALPMDLRSDKTSLFNLNHKMEINGVNLKSWNTSIFLTDVDHLMDNLEKNLDPRMVDAITNAETISYGGRTEGSWTFSSGRLYAGADLRVEKADGIRTRTFLMGPNSGKVLNDNVWNGGQISKTGLFTEYHHLFPYFNLVFSGRFEYNQATATELNDNFNSKNSNVDVKQLNPSFSIGGLKNFESGFVLGVWIGRAQRSGSITERYINSFPVGIDPYDMLGNPDLEPEVNNELDLTLSYYFGKTAIDLGFFASILKNYISSEIDNNLSPTMPSSPGVRRYKNIQDARMTGFEFNWNQGLLLGLSHTLSATYTYGQNQTTNDPLPEIAPLDFRYSLAGSYFSNKLLPEIVLRYVLQQKRISTIFGESETPSFSLMDVRVNYSYNSMIGATIGIQNLFDEAYYEHLSRSVRGSSRGIYAPGRNIYFSLKLDFM